MRRPNDTSVEARERHLDAYRAMTPEQRLRIADEMSTAVRSIAQAGIRARAEAKPTPLDEQSSRRR